MSTEVELTGRQRAILAELTDTEPITAPALARSMGENARYVRATLNALQRVGIVESDTYQRAVRVWLVVDPMDPGDKPLT